MALSRILQKIFGKNAESTDMGIVGSKASNNPQTSKDIAEIQSLSAWESGMRNIVSTTNAPYLQDHNSLFYVITTQLAYLFQAGIAEWESQTEYFADISYVSYGGEIYKAIANSTNQTPPNTSYWECVSNFSVVTKTYSSTIALDNNKINVVTLGGNVTFSLPTPTNTTMLNQIEVQLYKPTASYTVTLGTNKYLTNTTPNLSAAGYYNLYYEYDNNASLWYVGYVYKGV